MEAGGVGMKLIAAVVMPEDNESGEVVVRSRILIDDCIAATRLAAPGRH